MKIFITCVALTIVLAAFVLPSSGKAILIGFCCSSIILEPVYHLGNQRSTILVIEKFVFMREKQII